MFCQSRINLAGDFVGPFVFLSWHFRMAAVSINNFRGCLFYYFILQILPSDYFILWRIVQIECFVFSFFFFFFFCCQTSTYALLIALVSNALNAFSCVFQIVDAFMPKRVHDSYRNAYNVYRKVYTLHRACTVSIRACI